MRWGSNFRAAALFPDHVLVQSPLLQPCCNGGSGEELRACEPIEIIGGPERTRTSDLRFRKPLLYPTELRDRKVFYGAGSVSC